MTQNSFKSLLWGILPQYGGQKVFYSSALVQTLDLGFEAWTNLNNTQHCICHIMFLVSKYRRCNNCRVKLAAWTTTGPLDIRALDNCWNTASAPALLGKIKNESELVKLYTCGIFLVQQVNQLIFMGTGQFQSNLKGQSIHTVGKTKYALICTKCTFRQFQVQFQLNWKLCIIVVSAPLHLKQQQSPVQKHLGITSVKKHQAQNKTLHTKGIQYQQAIDKARKV